MTSNTRERTRARRQFLQLAGSAAVAGIAGCIDVVGPRAAPSAARGTPTRTKNRAETPAPAETETPSPTSRRPKPAVTVRSQETDGTEIVVESARTDRPGWLIVHPPDERGGPNPDVALGAHGLQPGSHTNLTVRLEEPIERSGRLFAVLHYDDPADGEYTFPWGGDATVTVDGGPVVRRFSVTVTEAVSPSIHVRDQETDGRNLTIARVAIDTPGWVVVHPPADDGGPNRAVALGRTRLQPGPRTGVPVTLDEPLHKYKHLFAALYYDAPRGDDSAPSPGPAVRIGNEGVVDSFSVTIDRPTRTITIDQSFDSEGVRDQTFRPRGVRVEPGTRVVWVNEDLSTHAVTIDSANHKWDLNPPYTRFDEKLAPSRGTGLTFWEPGAYQFYCRLHGKTSECGVVLVGDASLEGELPC